MSKRPCPSPVSEETIINEIRANGYDIGSDDGGENSLDDNVPSSSEEVVDDTDEDPTYDPAPRQNRFCFLPVTNRPISRPLQFDLSAPGPSRNVDTQQLGDVQSDQPRPTLEMNTSDEDEPDNPTIPARNRPRMRIGNVNRGPRGRRRQGRGGNQRTRPIDQRNENGSDSSDWEEVEDGNDPGFPETFQFSEVSGPKHCPARNASPKSYFDIFFTNVLLHTFVVQTNKYATDFLRSQENNLSPKSRLKSWINVTLQEMKAFIAVILNMGIIRKPTIESYWSKSSSQSTPWFSNMLSRNRFEILLKFFHIVDKDTLPRLGEPNYDPCGRFQSLIDHCNRLFKQYYIPNEKLSVDESLVGTKKRIAITQYIPKKKHHKWGIKLWVLCDADTKYCYQFYCYKGARYETERARIDRFGLGYTVVVKLLEMANLLNKGFHMFLDNFFVTKKLARYLYSKNTNLTGTVRIDRKGIPHQLRGKYPVGKKVYVRKGPILQMAYREKSTNKTQFILLSTRAKARNVRYTIRRSGRIVIKNKPEIVYQYNHGMGGIDGTDQMLYTYLDERRCMKHWKKVIFNIFGRMILNSYVIYKLNTDRPMDRLQFQVAVIEALAEEWLSVKNAGVNLGGGGDGPVNKKGFGVEQLEGGKEKICSVCSGKNNPEGKRRRSRTVCVNCKAGCHVGCLPQHKCKH